MDYNWVDWYEDEEGNVESCWVDADNFEKVVGMKIQQGQGLWVHASSDAGDQIFTSSGQVEAKDVTINLRKGGVLVGNPTPVAIDLQDIICSDNCSDEVSFHVLNNIGIGGMDYNWVNWYEDEEGNVESCWVDADNFEKVTGMAIDPGQSMWVHGSIDPSTDEPENNQTITFPGVEL